MLNDEIHVRDNFYIITGGPGSGKSTLIQALSQNGYGYVSEVGRQIIQEQLAIGGNAIHTGDRLKFRDLMLTRSIGDYLREAETDKPIFFDRGIPDLIGYSDLIEAPVPAEYKKATEIFRYNRLVLVTPPWEAIYQHDKERKQGFEEAVKTYENIVKAYQTTGYTVIELPNDSVDVRVDFIIQRILNNDEGWL